MTDILSIQLVNFLEFGGGSGIPQSRLLHQRDYEFTWEPETDKVIVRHRATGKTRVVPMANVVAIEPDMGQAKAAIIQAKVEADPAITAAPLAEQSSSSDTPVASLPVKRGPGRPPKVCPPEES